MTGNHPSLSVCNPYNSLCSLIKYLPLSLTLFHPLHSSFFPLQPSTSRATKHQMNPHPSKDKDQRKGRPCVCISISIYVFPFPFHSSAFLLSCAQFIPLTPFASPTLPLLRVTASKPPTPLFLFLHPSMAIGGGFSFSLVRINIERVVPLHPSTLAFLT